MNPIEQTLSERHADLSGSAIALLVTIAIFFAIGSSQLNLDYQAPAEENPIEEFYLPPPPPPALPDKAPPPEDISFDVAIDIDPAPFEISLDFLQVKVGMENPSANEINFDIDSAIADFKTDGLHSLRVYERNELDKPPALLKPFMPKPPMELRQFDIEAIVYFRLTPEGRAVNISVLQCNIPEAVELVKEAIAKSRYKPAIKDDLPVNAWVRQPFKLTGQKNKKHDLLNIN